MKSGVLFSENYIATMIIQTMQRASALLAALWISGMTASAGPTEDALRVGEEALAKKEYGSAVATWVNAYNERATANTANDETCATLLMKAGSLMAQLGRFNESSNCFELLFKLRSLINGPMHLETEKVKALLAAQIANSGGDLERAEALARESVKAMDKAGDEYFDDRLLALTNLAGILMLKKDRLGAHKIYAEVTTLCDKHPTKSLNLAIGAFISMASIADFFGRTKDQLNYMQKAVDLSRKHYGAKNAETYLARINLASTQMSAGLNADARTAFQGIVDEIAKDNPGAGDPVLLQRWATAEYRLALLESAIGNGDRSFELIQSSLNHARKGWSDLDANTLPLYLESAKGHIIRKNYSEGVKCYQKVLDIRRRELGPDHPSTRETQQILNELLEDVKKAKAGK